MCVRFSELCVRASGDFFLKAAVLVVEIGTTFVS
jgi:hypothetical protein